MILILHSPVRKWNWIWNADAITRDRHCERVRRQRGGVAAGLCGRRAARSRGKDGASSGKVGRGAACWAAVLVTNDYNNLKEVRVDAH